MYLSAVWLQQGSIKGKGDLFCWLMGYSSLPPLLDFEEGKCGAELLLLLLCWGCLLSSGQQQNIFK